MNPELSASIRSIRVIRVLLTRALIRNPSRISLFQRNESGNKKDKKWENAKSPENSSFCVFFPFLSFLFPSQLSPRILTSKRPSFNENESQLEGVILLIWRRRLSPFFA